MAQGHGSEDRGLEDPVHLVTGEPVGVAGNAVGESGVPAIDCVLDGSAVQSQLVCVHIETVAVSIPGPDHIEVGRWRPGVGHCIVGSETICSAKRGRTGN